MNEGSGTGNGVRYLGSQYLLHTDMTAVTLYYLAVISDTVISDTKVCCEDVIAIIAGCIVACQALLLPWPLS